MTLKKRQPKRNIPAGEEPRQRKLHSDEVQRILDIARSSRPKINFIQSTYNYTHTANESIFCDVCGKEVAHIHVYADPRDEVELRVCLPCSWQTDIFKYFHDTCLQPEDKYMLTAGIENLNFGKGKEVSNGQS